MESVWVMALGDVCSDIAGWRLLFFQKEVSYVREIEAVGFSGDGVSGKQQYGCR